MPKSTGSGGNDFFTHEMQPNDFGRLAFVKVTLCRVTSAKRSIRESDAPFAPPVAALSRLEVAPVHS